MFAKLLAASVVAILAVANPALAQDACTTGSIQCCQQVLPANSTSIAPILGALGVVVQDVNALVGLACNPIQVVGVGSGNACSAQTVCCEDNNVGGLLSVGCLPVGTA